MDNLHKNSMHAYMTDSFIHKHEICKFDKVKNLKCIHIKFKQQTI